MKLEIVQSSAKAAELVAKVAEGKRIANTRTLVYPFDDLEVGQSFSVVQSEGKYESLHAIASRKGKLQSKKFAVIKHNDTTPPCYEVARIA